MKEKPYSSTIAFFDFFPTYRIFKKLVYMHVRIQLILIVIKNLEKNSPTGSGNIGAQSWKYGKVTVD